MSKLFIILVILMSIIGIIYGGDTIADSNNFMPNGFEDVEIGMDMDKFVKLRPNANSMQRFDNLDAEIDITKDQLFYENLIKHSMFNFSSTFFLNGKLDMIAFSLIMDNVISKKESETKLLKLFSFCINKYGNKFEKKLLREKLENSFTFAIDELDKEKFKKELKDIHRTMKDILMENDVKDDLSNLSDTILTNIFNQLLEKPDLYNNLKEYLPADFALNNKELKELLDIIQNAESEIEISKIRFFNKAILLKIYPLTLKDDQLKKSEEDPGIPVMCWNKNNQTIWIIIFPKKENSEEIYMVQLWHVSSEDIFKKEYLVEEKPTDMRHFKRLKKYGINIEE